MSQVLTRKFEQQIKDDKELYNKLVNKYGTELEALQ